MIRPSGTGRRFLRRYHYSAVASPDTGAPCPLMPGAHSYHNAETFIDVCPDVPNPVTGIYEIEPYRSRSLFPDADPRWPVTCGCGYVFVPGDQWQVYVDQIYRDDAGKDFSLHDRIPGMMWEVPWYYDPVRDAARLPERLRFAREGKSSVLSVRYYERDAATRAPVCVVTPNGDEWCIDSIARNGPGWACDGVPPLLVCSPSIQTPNYHGWLGSNHPGTPSVRPGWFTDGC